MKARTRPLTSNRVIDLMLDHRAVVIKTLGKRGPIYSLDPLLRLVPNEVAERMIEKGTLLPREESGQSFELAPSWGAEPVGRMMPPLNKGARS